jgi:hypothetical protein
MIESSLRHSSLQRLWLRPKNYIVKWALFGVPIGGACLAIIWFWRKLPTRQSVDVPLAVAKSVAVILVAALFLWFARKKNREIERLTARVLSPSLPTEPETRDAEEEILLAALWHSPGSHPTDLARAIPDRDGKMIGYQLERLERAQLVASTLASYFRLTPAGRNYVVRQSLNDRTVLASFEPTLLGPSQVADGNGKGEIDQDRDKTGVKPENRVPVGQNQKTG